MVKRIEALNLKKIASIHEKQVILNNQTMTLIIFNLEHNLINNIINANNLKNMFFNLRDQYFKSE